MAEELQSLIERIQKEGIRKAEEEADKIIGESKEKAARIIKEAEKEAETIKNKGKEEADVFLKRSTTTLQQAARDILISIGKGIEDIFQNLISDTTGETLSPEAILKIVVEMAGAYVEKGFTTNNITLLVSPSDQDALKKLYIEKYKEKIATEVVISSDDSIIKGFKISFKDGRIHHDFTREAIAEALSFLVRPQLAEIVAKAAAEQVKTT